MLVKGVPGGLMTSVVYDNDIQYMNPYTDMNEFNTNAYK